MAGADKKMDKKTAPKVRRPVPPVTKDTLWLVKSGDRVLGPFVTTEVIRRLRAKELVVIDEVISPQSRWRHIRDEAAFSSVVDEIRKGLMATRDDTEVGTATPGSGRGHEDDGPPTALISGHATQAQFDAAMQPGRISDAELVSETDDRKPIHHQASVRDVKAPAGMSGSTDVGGRNRPVVHSTLSYAPPGSTTAPPRFFTRTSRALWLVIALAVVITAGGAAFLKWGPGRRAGGRMEEQARLRGEADRAWDRAEFARALKLYEQINREPHPDLETELRQAILMLRVERETLGAKRRIEELLPKLPPDAKTRARMALALVALQSDEPQEAQTAFAKLVQEPDSGPIAYFNLACAQAALGRRDEAIQNLRKLESHASLEEPSRLLRALLHLREQQPRQAAAAVESPQPQSLAAWRQELFAIGAVADWFDGNKKRSTVRLRTALDTDPVQTEEFFHDPLLYIEAIRWKQMLPFIQDFAARAKTNGAKALLGLAMVKADRRGEAQSMIAESLSAKMNDEDLQAVNAYGLMVQGRDDEARAALRFVKNDKRGRIAKTDSYPIAAILEARLCERAGDQNCADMVWSELAKRSTPPVAAEVSVARIEGQMAKEKGAAAAERLKLRYPTSVPVDRLYDEYVRRRGSRP